MSTESGRTFFSPYSRLLVLPIHPSLSPDTFWYFISCIKKQLSVKLFNKLYKFSITVTVGT